MTTEISRKKKSLCEKTVMLVANFTKLLSLSLASVSFGTSFKQPAADDNCVPETAPKLPSMNISSVPRLPRSQRSQETESNSKSYSCLIEPEEHNSSYVTRENNIDERAAEFIERIHESY
ncbi:hypothetical protein CJ030_MR7G026893 [Morella rubra]|uniref:Uncharacterized protein n=1 Tax=Morella rubra TaxID=262757 RepID=A0A6A1V576_9ROSI|nr:hypothetical protein CJ030_MR7G026893 [Morella rubra]